MVFPCFDYTPFRNSKLATLFKDKYIFLYQGYDERGTPIIAKGMAGLEAETSNTTEKNSIHTVIISNRLHQSYQK